MLPSEPLILLGGTADLYPSIYPNYDAPGGLLLGGFAAPTSVQAQTPTATAPVTGTFTDAVGGIGNFVGTFGIPSFARQGGNLVANGVLQGTLTDSLGCAAWRTC